VYERLAGIRDPLTKISCLDEVQGLVDRLLGAEGEGGIDFGRDLAGDDLENLLAKLD
jgi:hypothetical protein